MDSRLKLITLQSQFFYPPLLINKKVNPGQTTRPGQSQNANAGRIAAAYRLRGEPQELSGPREVDTARLKVLQSIAKINGEGRRTSACLNRLPTIRRAKKPLSTGARFDRHKHTGKAKF
jgi:hypothetical protein